MLLKMICSAALLMGAAQAQDGWKAFGEIAVPACREYLKATMPEKEQAEWRVKLKARVEERVQSSPSLSESTALQSISLDWLTDNETKLRDRSQKHVRYACLLFIWFWENNIDPPSQVADRLKEQDARDMAQYLRDQAAEAKK